MTNILNIQLYISNLGQAREAKFLTPEKGGYGGMDGIKRLKMNSGKMEMLLSSNHLMPHSSF